MVKSNEYLYLYKVLGGGGALTRDLPDPVLPVDINKLDPLAGTLQMSHKVSDSM